MNASNSTPLVRKPALWMAGLLFGLAWLVYANTLQHGYVWDDAIAIVENPRVQAGWSGIPDHFEFRARADIADFNGYRPVALSSHSMDIALFGSHPEPAHAMQVFWFALLVVIAFFTLRSLFPGKAPVLPLLACLLFVVHPVHVEVVANLKSRDEILALLFGLGAVWSLSLFLDRGKLHTGLLGGLCFLLAVLSKESAVGFLGIFVLVAGWKGEVKWSRFWMWWGSLIGGMLLLFWALTGHLPGASPPETTTAFIENMVVSNSHAVDMGFFQRLANSGYLLLLYLKSFLWPVEQVYFSGYNQIPVVSPGSFWGLAGLIALVGVPVLALWAWFREGGRAFSFGLLFFGIALAIYLQLFFRVPDTFADRFLFAPSLGLCWALVAGWNWIRGTEPGLFSWPPAKRDWIWMLPLLGFGLWCGVQTTLRNPAWKDNLTLFQTDMPRLENCARAHYYLANALEIEFRAGKPGPGSEEEVIRHYRRGIAISPLLFYARTDLGNFLTHLERYGEAIEVLEAACEEFPTHADPWHYLGMAQYLSNRFSEAEASFSKAYALSPTDLRSCEMKGRSAAQSGNFEAGLQSIAECLEKWPRQVMLHDVLSDLHFFQGDTAASFLPLHRILVLEPTNEFFWKKTIGRYQLTGQDGEAARYYQMARSQGLLQP